MNTASKIVNIDLGLNATTALAHFTDLLTEREGLRESIWHVVYRMVAAMVAVAERYRDDDAFAKSWSKALKERDIPLPAAAKGYNPYLHIVRLAGGKWKTPSDRSKSLLRKWESNRSFEKHAGVIRFCMENNIASSDVYAILSEKRDVRQLNPDVRMKDQVIKKATLGKLMNADKARHGKPREADQTAQQGMRPADKPPVWTEELAEAAEAVRPLLRVPLTETVSSAIDWQEDEYAVVVVRRVKGQMLLMGDTGLKGNSVMQQVADRYHEWSKLNASLTVNEDEQPRAEQPARKTETKEVAVPDGKPKVTVDE